MGGMLKVTAVTSEDFHSCFGFDENQQEDSLEFQF